MRLRCAAAIAVLACSVVNAPGQAVAPRTAGRFAAELNRRPLAGAEPGFWGRLVGPDGRADASRAWRESARAVATAARPFARVEAGAEAKSETLVDVGQAGDLDGDGGADVALFRLTYSVQPVWVLDRVDVETRSGRTGKRIWTKRVTLPKPTCENAGCGHLFSFGYAFTTPVGGRAGIEVVLFGQLADHNVVRDPATGIPLVLPGSSYLNTFDAITLDRHGRQKWARHVEGRIRLLRAVERIEHLPVLHDVSAGLEPGADLDWLYDSVEGVLRPGDTTTVLGQRVEIPAVDLTTTQTYALDGRTGKDRAIGPERDGQYGHRDQVLVGDLSGDGRDDIVAIPPLSFDEARAATMSAHRSTDGAALWQRVTRPANYMLVGDIGDHTGDRRTDLVVTPVVFESSATVPFDLTNGATGKTLWSRSAATFAPVTGRRPLLAFGTSRRTGGKAVVTVSVHDGRNRTLYTRRFAVSGQNAAHTEGASLSILGDLDDDGTEDINVQARVVVTTKSGNSTTTRTSYVPLGAITGVTGRALPKYGAETYALYDSVDGRGDDVETDGSSGARIRDGRTGRTLLAIGVGQPVYTIIIGTQHADRDRCLDVFVAAYLRHSVSIVYGIVSGATGRVLWQTRDGARTSARIRTSGRTYDCR